jgi:cytoskeletal protein CcmA (bactofilin family)
MATHPYAPANFMRSEAGSNRLTVGADIRLKGEIEACDTLVVEGRIEAALESRLLHIAENGAFSGSAVVDIAEISGTFEGNLTVRDRLVVRTTGKVGGTVQYRRLEVQDGGEVTGDIRTLAEHKEAPAVRKIEPPANDRRDDMTAKASNSGLREGKTLQ